MSAAVPDVIDLLTGVAPNSPMHEVRAQRPQARDNAQASYLALFQPADPAEMTLRERHAVAVFVAGLHRQPEIGAFYATGLADAGGDPPLGIVIAAETALGLSQGPYGRYPTGPLSPEDQPGALHRVQPAHRATLGPRLTAAFEHAHLLVFHPRDATPDALQRLLDAGWSTTGIVTLSQLVAFLAFQIRVVAGLRSLPISPAGNP